MDYCTPRTARGSFEHMSVLQDRFIRRIGDFIFLFMVNNILIPVSLGPGY